MLNFNGILFVGPSYTVETACSSSVYAIQQAAECIKNGKMNAAIVGGCNLCLAPELAVPFLRLGMTSPDGMCKSFDDDGNK